MIGLFDEAVDRSLELDDRAEDAALETALGELGEEALDGVEPGAGGRREVEDEARVALQPRLDLRVFVRGVVVEDDVHDVADRHGGLDAVNEIAICLASLEEHFDDEHFWLTIIDNASDAATLALLRKYRGRPRVKIIESGANYGFTHAVNIGIEHSPPDCDVVLLNNDAIATPGCFSAMQEEHIFDSDAGLIVPQQVLLPGSLDDGNPRPRGGCKLRTRREPVGL